MPNIVIVPQSKRQRKTKQREHKNVFSDATTLFFLRLLQGKSDLPETLAFEPAVSRDLQRELAAAIRHRLLPWFWSLLLHTTLLILLAFWLFPIVRFEPLDVLSGIANIPAPEENPQINPLGNEENNTPVADENVQENGVETPTPAPELPTVELPTVEPEHLSPGLNFSGRDINSRAAMLSGGGGSGETDEAVLAGLRWLVKVQLPNGAWDFRGNFPQSAGERQKDALAATAMALLAFQGYGITADSRHPQLIEFARPVRRGWDWLLKQQNPDGSFFPSQPTSNQNHRFYTHGFCTIAICELLAMTGNETLREPAQKAVDYCVQHQSLRRGGWRYLPDRFSEQSDVSVTGWMVLALKSGQAAGLTVPPEVYDRVMDFLDTMTVDDRYKYREEEPEPRISMTAEALLCRILLGWKREEPQLASGIKLIVQTPPSFADHYQRDVYYWFFATQTLFHYGGADWETWNSLMREELIRQQEKFGEERGSWNSHRPVRDRWVQYGRLYTTCMSLYILEVYYRHQRIFW